MRKNFAQVLKLAHIDIKKEYTRLYNLFYAPCIQEKLLRDIIDENFPSFHFRGTCLTLDEFDETNGFYFEEYPDNFDLDYLVNFCEYFFNLLIGLNINLNNSYSEPNVNMQFFVDQINRVIETIGYMQSSEDGFVIFVEKSESAIAVSEIVSAPLSYKVIAYNHYSMRGNLDAKKATILQFAYILEGQRKILHNTDATLETDLFYLFNNLNLRHNNSDPKEKGKYKVFVAKMTQNEIEYWYDETYQMCLLAFLELDNIERKQAFDAMKDKINIEQ